MKLYELANEYQTLADYADQITSPEGQANFDAALAGIKDEYADKLEGCAKVLASLRAQESAIGEEVKRLKARMTALNNSQNRLRQYMQVTMEVVGSESFKTTLFSIWIQDNPPSVAVENEKAIPKKYWIKQEPMLSKALILDDLKAGKVVPGVHIEVGRSLRVR